MEKSSSTKFMLVNLGQDLWVREDFLTQPQKPKGEK